VGIGALAVPSCLLGAEGPVFRAPVKIELRIWHLK